MNSAKLYSSLNRISTSDLMKYKYECTLLISRCGTIRIGSVASLSLLVTYAVEAYSKSANINVAITSTFLGLFGAFVLVYIIADSIRYREFAKKELIDDILILRMNRTGVLTKTKERNDTKGG